jgi:hypothetical protein
MMDRKEREYIQKLRVHAVETVLFFSNSNKADRERCACAAFLRCLGLDFSAKDLVAVSQKESPPDVIFRSARFEVSEVLGKGQKRHHEAKVRAGCLMNAESIDDTLVPFPPRIPLKYADVFKHINEVLAKKAAHYGTKVCSKLDALTYMDIPYTFLVTTSPLSRNAPLQKQGWRSVSFIMPPHSHVLYASDSAPDFLRDLAGLTKQEWNDWDRLFKL